MRVSSHILRATVLLVAILACSLLGGCNSNSAHIDNIPTKNAGNEGLQNNDNIAGETPAIAQEKNSVSIANDSGDIIVEIFSKHPVDSVLLDECAAEVVESQNKVESGEIEISYPDNVPMPSSPEQAMPHFVEITDADTGDTLAYVSVTKQAEPSVLNKILSKIIHAQE